jgi:hypothetical protein
MSGKQRVPCLRNEMSKHRQPLAARQRHLLFYLQIPLNPEYVKGKMNRQAEKGYEF